MYLKAISKDVCNVYLSCHHSLFRNTVSYKVFVIYARLVCVVFSGWYLLSMQDFFVFHFQAGIFARLVCFVFSGWYLLSMQGYEEAVSWSGCYSSGVAGFYSSYTSRLPL